MSRLSILFLSAAAVLVFAATALAEPYWIAWEGDDFPENQGWQRNYGNWDGPNQGGAYRTLEDGLLTIDSLYDDGVYDYYELRDNYPISLEPDELFVAEWRLKVDALQGLPVYDSAVGIHSDDYWIVALGFYPDHIESVFEDINIAIRADIWHNYRLETSDMRQYTLVVDGEPAHQGVLWNGVTSSRIGWGDVVQGSKYR